MSWGPLVAALALLLANAFFVAAEFGLLAARRSAIEQQVARGNRRARQTLASMRELSLMLAGAQLGITMASLGLGAVAEPAIAHGLEAVLHSAPLSSGVRHGLAVGVALSVVVFLHMVIGEMAPKSWAIAGPTRAALLLAPPFRGFVLVLRPFIRLLNAAANGVVRLTGVQPQDELAMAHSPADLLLVVEESRRHGRLAAEQHDLLARVLDLSGLDAQSAMTPRSDVVGAPSDATVDDLEEVAARTGRSRLVIYDDELDRVRGILHVKDLLTLPRNRRDVTAGALARPVLVVPESRHVDDLIVDMRQQRQHLAVVVDEYGSVSGLVSLEDLLEELIGEFEDESDELMRALPVRRRADGAFLVPASLRPDQLEGATGVALPEGEWETIAGYVLAALGRVPSVGDVADADHARIEVLRMAGHRISEVAVLVVPEAEQPEQGS